MFCSIHTSCIAIYPAFWYPVRSLLSSWLCFSGPATPCIWLLWRARSLWGPFGLEELILIRICSGKFPFISIGQRIKKQCNDEPLWGCRVGGWIPRDRFRSLHSHNFTPPPSQYHSLGDTYTYASDITLFMITHYFYSGYKKSQPESHWISSLFDWHISGCTLENCILYL